MFTSARDPPACPMSFSNRTSFAALDVPYLDASGQPVACVMVKATFMVHDRVQLADEQRPVRLGDVVYDEDAADSSVRYPCDLVPSKRGSLRSWPACPT